MKKMVITVLLVLSITGVLFGSGQSDSSEAGNTVATADEDVIVIGNLQDLSGAMSVAGKNTKWGVEYAVDEINNNGGINGKMIKLVSYDIKLNANEAINAYTRLVEQDGAVAVVGPGLSNIGIPLAPIAEQKKVAIVGQFMDERAIINEQSGEAWNYMFLAEPSCSQQAEIMASYAVEVLKLKSVGILYDSSNAYATKHAEPFKTYLESKGVDVVGVESFGSGAKDYKAQISKIIMKKPEAIYIPNYVQTNALAFKQARLLGFNGMILGNNTWGYPLPDLVDGLSVDSNLLFLQNVDIYSPRMIHMTQDYISDFNGQQPTINMAFGYDDVKIIANALMNVEDVTNPAEIAKYIENNTVKVDTASGPITINPESHRPVGMGAYVAGYNTDNTMDLIKYYIAKD